ncbi:MAG: hypothetical protein AABY32_00935 [Nanoarchaeota archaeon]
MDFLPKKRIIREFSLGVLKNPQVWPQNFLFVMKIKNDLHLELLGVVFANEYIVHAIKQDKPIWDSIAAGEDEIYIYKSYEDMIDDNWFVNPHSYNQQCCAIKLKWSGE